MIALVLIYRFAISRFVNALATAQLSYEREYKMLINSSTILGESQNKDFDCIYKEVC